MAIVKFKDKVFEYTEENIHEHDNPSHEEVKQLLFKTKEFLDESGIQFMLGFGTLLGALREKDFIKNDPDIDLIVEDEEKLFNALPRLKEKGLRLVRAENKALYSLRMKGNVYLDLYILSPAEKFPWNLYCSRLEFNYIPAKYFKKKHKIEFLGKDFECPENPERLMRFWYGKNWMIPADKNNYYSHYEVFSRQIIRSPKIALKWLFRKIIGDKLYLKLKARK